MAAPAPSAKALKRSLKALQASEKAASTWLVRLSLFVALASWAFSEYYSGSTGTQGKAAGKGASAAGTQVFVWVGAAMGVVRLGMRFYFQRQRKGLDEQLLEVEPVAPVAKKKSKRQK